MPAQTSVADNTLWFLQETHHNDSPYGLLMVQVRWISIVFSVMVDTNLGRTRKRNKEKEKEGLRLKPRTNQWYDCSRLLPGNLFLPLPVPFANFLSRLIAKIMPEDILTYRWSWRFARWLWSSSIRRPFYFSLIRKRVICCVKRNPERNETIVL